MIGLSVRRIYDFKLGKGEDSAINGVERRIKRITAFGNPPASQACMSSGGRTTVAAYFKGAYYLFHAFRIMLTLFVAGGLTITRPDLDCVNVGARATPAEPWKGTWIPAEFLEIVPHQPYTRLLDGIYTKNMLDVACKRPPQNLFLIMNEGIPKINLQELVRLTPHY
jgi:hypothetical protein